MCHCFDSLSQGFLSRPLEASLQRGHGCDDLFRREVTPFPCVGRSPGRGSWPNQVSAVGATPPAGQPQRRPGLRPGLRLLPPALLPLLLQINQMDVKLRESILPVCWAPSRHPRGPAGARVPPSPHDATKVQSPHLGCKGERRARREHAPSTHQGPWALPSLPPALLSSSLGFRGVSPPLCPHITGVPRFSTFLDLLPYF